MLCKADFSQIIFLAVSVNVIFGADLKVGESCQPWLDKPDQGTCVRADGCPEVISYILKKKSHPFERCAFENNVEIVCCPESPAADPPNGNTKRPLEIYCEKLVRDAIFPLSDHVLGGVDVKKGEFPHMVALGFVRSDEYEFNCGGALISEYYVVTAAHCINNRNGGDVSIVRMGVVDIGTSKFNSETDIKIAETILHPDYKPLIKYNDLALLKLESAARHTFLVAPACLYNEGNIPTIPLTVTGWGKYLENKETHSKILQKAELKGMPDARCKEIVPVKPRLSQGIQPSQFCASDPRGLSDSCQGDSGGPIQALTSSDGYYRILGVTSFGHGCGSPIPGVYTRLYSHLDWIESVIWPNGLSD